MNTLASIGKFTHSPTIALSNTYATYDIANNNMHM